MGLAGWDDGLVWVRSFGLPLADAARPGAHDIMSKRNHILSWVSWAGADALVRVIALGGVTFILSRLLDPADFGVSAIVLATAAAAGLVVGAPFQDALVQRRVLRKLHLQSALAASLVIGLLLIGGSILLAPQLASAYSAPEIQLLLPITMVSILFSGHGELVGARARRQKRFTEIAAADLVSHLVAAPVAVTAALLGAGVWSLILLRLVAVLVQSLILQARVGYPLLPRFSSAHLADLRRIASIASLDRITDNLTYLVLSNLVASLFGLAMLGQLNMAMRVIEPLRGAVMAAIHNFTFPTFRRIAYANVSPAERDLPVRVLANVTGPIFAGLACVIPLVLPLVTGPGWENAVPIAIGLALGSAIAMPTQPIFTALTAQGRPEYGLLGSLTRLCLTLLTLLVLREWALLAVSLARVSGDVCTALLGLLVPLKNQAWSARTRLALLLPAWGAMVLMSVVTCAVIWAIGAANIWAALPGGILTGIATYYLLLRLLQPDVLSQLLEIVIPARGRRSVSG